MSNPASKQATRDELNAQIAAFIAKGGTIKKLPTLKRKPRKAKG